MIDVKYSWWDEEHQVMVLYLPLPEGIDECVTINDDLSHTIIISTDICPDRQKKAFLHALCHIERNHLEDGIEVGKCENECRMGVA